MHGNKKQVIPWDDQFQHICRYLSDVHQIQHPNISNEGRYQSWEIPAAALKRLWCRSPSEFLSEWQVKGQGFTLWHQSGTLSVDVVANNSIASGTALMFYMPQLMAHSYEDISLFIVKKSCLAEELQTVQKIERSDIFIFSSTWNQFVIFDVFVFSIAAIVLFRDLSHKNAWVNHWQGFNSSNAAINKRIFRHMWYCGALNHLWFKMLADYNLISLPALFKWKTKLTHW